MRAGRHRRLHTICARYASCRLRGKRPHCNRRLAKVEVYLFNEKGFIRKIPTDISSDLIFRDDKNERLTLVVWGNIKKDTLIAPDIPIGTTIEEARFRLREDTEGSHLPITDIFYCKRK